MQVNLIDKLVSFENDTNGDLVIKHTQVLPDDYLSALKRKVMPTKTASGEYEKLFSIPTAVIDNWYARGIDYQQLSDREIARLLRAEGLDAFIVGRI
jgi:hypothetical protein